MIAAVLSATSSIEVLIRTHHAEMARYSLVNLASTQSIYAHLFLIFNTKDSNRRRTKSNSTKKEKRNIWFLLFQHPWDRYYHQLRLSISSVWSNWFQILFFFLDCMHSRDLQMLYNSPRSDAMHLLRTFKLYYIKSDERIQFSPAYNSLFFF